jgi:hypothetical protein
MHRGHKRVCGVCREEILANATFYRGTLSPSAAAGLLDVDDVRLVPTWTQLPDLTVQIDLCSACFNLMDEPYGVVELR